MGDSLKCSEGKHAMMKLIVILFTHSEIYRRKNRRNTINLSYWWLIGAAPLTKKSNQRKTWQKPPREDNGHFFHLITSCHTSSGFLGIEFNLNKHPLKRYPGIILRPFIPYPLVFGHIHLSSSEQIYSIKYMFPCTNVGWLFDIL